MGSGKESAGLCTGEGKTTLRRGTVLLFLPDKMSRRVVALTGGFLLYF